MNPDLATAIANSGRAVKTGYAHDQKHRRPRVTHSMAGIIPYYEDRVLVKRLPAESHGLIAAPNQDAREKVGDQIGIVISVGKGATYFTLKDGTRVDYKCGPVPFDVQPGDKIKYSRVPPNEFVQDGETYTFLFEEQHILCVLG